MDPLSVFKTLIAATSEGALVVAIVAVSGRLDLKALASAAGVKKAVMADPADAERSSGYVVGGISPFGQRKKLAAYVDETIFLSDEVCVSGGRRGLDLGLTPDALVSMLDAVVAPIGTD